MTTDDDQIMRRVLMYNDVVGGQRNHIPADEILPGVNFRLSELQGAVALVQLGRLDDLLHDMRQANAEITEGITGLAQQHGVSFRRLNDRDGDTAIAIMLTLPTAERASFAAKAIAAEGVDTLLLYDPERVDYHVYAHWQPILNKRTWSEHGGPWRWHDGPVDYRVDMCPRTLDLLGRTVQLDVSPELSERNVTEVVDAVNKVLAAL